jgi:hypothetical protein
MFVMCDDELMAIIRAFTRTYIPTHIRTCGVTVASSKNELNRMNRMKSIMNRNEPLAQITNQSITLS